MPLKKVNKPWGWELWFARTPKYVGKIIFVKRGHRLSKQFHRYKHETVYAHAGSWILEIAGRKKRMRPGQSAVIKPGTVHRFTAPLEDAYLLEVSTP